MLVRPPLRERPCCFDAVLHLGACRSEGHERHHVEGAEARVHTFVVVHAHTAGYGSRQVAHGILGVTRSGTGQRVHAAVVVVVEVPVEQR